MSGSKDDKTTFLFRLLYTAPSKETTFLGSGWGPRDVRGPYMRSNHATIAIPSEMFSGRTHSSIQLRLSASNRLHIDRVSMNVVVGETTKRVTIPKNASAEIVFNNVKPKELAIEIGIAFSKEFSEEELERLKFIVSIDELLVLGYSTAYGKDA